MRRRQGFGAAASSGPKRAPHVSGARDASSLSISLADAATRGAVAVANARGVGERARPSIGWASEVDHDRGYHDGDDAAFGDQWWRVSNDEGVSQPEPPSEQNLGDDEILYGDI